MVNLLQKRLLALLTLLVLTALVALPVSAAATVIIPLEPSFSANSVIAAE